MNRLITTLAALAALSAPVCATSAPAHVHRIAVASAGVQTARDGRHDFDWLDGSWSATFKRLRHPLTGSHEWYSFPGSMHVAPIWGGSGNIETGRLNSSQGSSEYATLRLYDAQTRQWSIYWATPKAGLGTPPEVGSFDGRGNGTFYAWHDAYGTRAIASRFQWTVIDPGKHYRFEQAFSIDRGATWETNWISDLYRK